ncbi:hypothetical protein VKT23_017705 [Stygiomarasmius scandens]|uniref:Uncharacterized protein n=1 Tax=Marasmiellus scandens TaxID=2682957 RepID=A0ABR1IV53_9AGAR
MYSNDLWFISANDKQLGIEDSTEADTTHGSSKYFTSSSIKSASTSPNDMYISIVLPTAAAFHQQAQYAVLSQAQAQAEQRDRDEEVDEGQSDEDDEQVDELQDDDRQKGDNEMGGQSTGEDEDGEQVQEKPRLPHLHWQLISIGDNLMLHLPSSSTLPTPASALTSTRQHPMDAQLFVMSKIFDFLSSHRYPSPVESSHEFAHKDHR